MGSGNTEGVFQFESSGMKAVLQRLKPEHMEDLIAVISLYRPGPMESIPTYIETGTTPTKFATNTRPLSPSSTSPMAASSIRSRSWKSAGN